MIQDDEPVGGFYAAFRRAIATPDQRLIGWSAFGGFIVLAVIVFAGLSGLVLLCWNAFIQNNLGGPALTFGGSCGFVGLVLLLAALIVVIGMLLVDRD